METNRKISVPITDPKEIDLTRHALIEASAGTGKTYTIENLVVRLLTEQPEISIENILLVTFTEKATGELKVRIREKIEQQFDVVQNTNISLGLKLKAALDNFEQAAVFTIHGFCQNILSELAFENNALFENELKDDHAIYDGLLKEQIRKVWPQRYGSLLPELLQICQFAVAKEGLLTNIINIARNFSPAAGDCIIPCCDHDSYADFRLQLVTKARELSRLLVGPPLLSQTYNKLNINAKSRGNLIRKVLQPLEKFLINNDFQPFDVGELCELFDNFRKVKSIKDQGLSALIPSKWLKKGPNIEVCPNLEAVVTVGTELEQLIPVAVHWLVRETIFDLKAAVAAKKQQHGWISFDDMLIRVYETLFSDTASVLLKRLREKYKIAFVDEFQDTDPVQWRIFRRIFIDDIPKHGYNPLIIIGDPKQAIYSFRGADVYAYLEARSIMAELAEKQMANLYSLSYNWRSLPQLVDCFNRLFSQSTWFDSEVSTGPYAIGYSRSMSPKKEMLPLAVTDDDSCRASLNLLDLRSLPKSSHARKTLGVFIASEIKHLVNSSNLWFAKKNGEKRALDYGDVCILVRGKTEALPIEAYLRVFGIPYSFYKKPGLFQSEQAEELSLVLAAVLDPADTDRVKKALLTSFFNADVLFLYTYNELPVTHPVRKLLLVWNELATQRQWSPLFQSLMEDSGLIFRLSPQPDWDRIHTNFSQIFEHLESEAYRRNLDSRALLALLDSYRSQTVTAEEGADIHQIETEDRKVQIMTMHVSKGLQFPVVFLAGGLTRPFQNKYHLFHQFDTSETESRIERVFDLASQNSSKHKKELDDEDRRLFYVAATRAQLKLYLPYYPVTAASTWVGPLSKFIAASIEAAFTNNDNQLDIHWIQVAPGFTDNSPTKEVIPLSKTESIPVSPENFALPPEDHFQARKVRLTSFSSLNAMHVETSLQSDFHPNLIPEKDSDDDWMRM
ncbi:MAG: UvrD-helicase domain-containing protein, partial [Desulfobacteraceae bacterium]